MALNLPYNLEPVIMLTLGYPAKIDSPDRHSTRRKSMEEIVSWY